MKSIIYIIIESKRINIAGFLNTPGIYVIMPSTPPALFDAKPLGFCELTYDENMLNTICLYSDLSLYQLFIIQDFSNKVVLLSNIESGIMVCVSVN